MSSDNTDYLGLNEIFNEINEIRNQFNVTLNISDQIENIRSSLLLSLPHHSNLQDNIHNLNEKSCQLRSISLSIRYLLSQIKLKQIDSNGIKLRIHQIQLTTLRNQYHSLLTKINENDRIYRLVTKQRLDRQLYLLGRAPSNDQLDKFIVVPDIMIDNQDEIALLHNQSKQIHHMENTLKEMKDLFDDFSYFVECQNEIINSIDEKIFDSEIKIEEHIENFSSLPSAITNKSKISFSIIIIIVFLFILVSFLFILFISIKTFLRNLYR